MRRKEKNWVDYLLNTVLFVVVIVLFVLGVCLEWVPKKPAQVQQKIEHKNIRISPTNVHAGFNPVLIWSEDGGVTNRRCTGGLFTDKPTGKDYVLTCGHAFWNLTGGENKPRRYYYQIIQPYDETFHPISAVQQIDHAEPGAKTNASQDVVVCTPGPSAIISPLNNAEQGDGWRSFEVKFGKARPQDKATAYSIVTGEPVEYLGYAQLENGRRIAVLDYPTLPGESGTLFVTQDEQIYILSRGMPVDDSVAKILDVPTGHKSVSLCAMVRLK